MDEAERTGPAIPAESSVLVNLAETVEHPEGPAAHVAPAPLGSPEPPPPKAWEPTPGVEYSEIWVQTDGVRHLLTAEELAARLEAAPPEPRRLIAKSLVQERVNDIGKLGAVFAALQSQPIFFGRWFAPDWPQVYADDEGLLAILQSVGCTPAQIAVVTAP